MYQQLSSATKGPLSLNRRVPELDARLQAMSNDKNCIDYRRVREAASEGKMRYILHNSEYLIQQVYDFFSIENYKLHTHYEYIRELEMKYNIKITFMPQDAPTSGTEGLEEISISWKDSYKNTEEGNLGFELFCLYFQPNMKLTFETRLNADKDLKIKIMTALALEKKEVVCDKLKVIYNRDFDLGPFPEYGITNVGWRQNKIVISWD